MNHDSPVDIRAVLSDLGMKPQKRWGQNFLVNRGVRKKITGLLSSSQGQGIWEIGPGFGAMTELLLVNSWSPIILFEIDWKLIGYLRNHYAQWPEVRIVSGDFIKTWREEMSDHGSPLEIIGNLPYRSAASIIGSFIRYGSPAGRMVFTLQKELANRLLARPSQKNYSSFTVLTQIHFDVLRHGDISSGSFYPRPDVTSSIIELRSLTPDLSPGKSPLLMVLTRKMFHSRRKTIRNNLKQLDIGAETPSRIILAACLKSGIDPDRRAEEYPPEAFVSLLRELETEDPTILPSG